MPSSDASMAAVRRAVEQNIVQLSRAGAHEVLSSEKTTTTPPGCTVSAILRQRCNPSPGRGKSCNAQPSAKGQSPIEELLLSGSRNRSAIQRMFGRLKDFRRIAAR
jgi:hypothetical protein